MVVLPPVAEGSPVVGDAGGAASFASDPPAAVEGDVSLAGDFAFPELLPPHDEAKRAIGRAATDRAWKRRIPRRYPISSRRESPPCRVRCHAASSRDGKPWLAPFVSSRSPQRWSLPARTSRLRCPARTSPTAAVRSRGESRAATLRARPSMPAGPAMSGSSPTLVRLAMRPRSPMRMAETSTRRSPSTHPSTPLPARTEGPAAQCFRNRTARSAWRSRALRGAARAKISSSARTRRGLSGGVADRRASPRTEASARRAASVSSACLEKGFPLAVLRRRAEKDLRRHGPLRPKRTSREAHVRFLRRAPTLA